MHAWLSLAFSSASTPRLIPHILFHLSLPRRKLRREVTYLRSQSLGLLIPPLEFCLPLRDCHRTLSIMDTKSSTNPLLTHYYRGAFQ